jgi:hypothetical protein
MYSCVHLFRISWNFSKKSVSFGEGFRLNCGQASSQEVAVGWCLNGPIQVNRSEKLNNAMKLKDKLIRWLALRLPTCKEVTRMASDTMERKLPLRQRLDMKLHLLICTMCMRYVKQLQFMHDAIQQHAAQIETGATSPLTLPDDARERMKQRLKV